MGETICNPARGERCGVANGLEICGDGMLEIKAWDGRRGPEALAPRSLQTTRLCLIISLLFLSIRPSAPDPSRHLPAQSGAPLCARAQPVHQSNAHRGGGVPSVKSYVAVCSNPLVHGGRRASSHWLLLAPTPTDPRVGLRSSFQAHGFLPSITPNQCRFSGGRVGETICNPPP